VKKIILSIRFGIAISGSLIAYFLILTLFNSHTSPIYSLFNFVIVAFGIYEAINSFNLSEGDKFSYNQGFKIGITSGFVATIIFTVFFAFYVIEIDADFFNRFLESFNRNEIIYYSNSESNYFEFMDNLNEAQELGDGIAILVVIVTLSSALIMGFITTLVLTLILMQLIMRSNKMLQNTIH